MHDIMGVIIHILRPLSKSSDCAFLLQRNCAEEDRKQKRSRSVPAFGGTLLSVFFSLITEKACERLHMNMHGERPRLLLLTLLKKLQWK